MNKAKKEISRFGLLQSRASKIIISPNVVGIRLITANGDLADAISPYVTGSGSDTLSNELKDSVAEMLRYTAMIANIIEYEIPDVDHIIVYQTKEAKKSMPYNTAAEVTRAVATIITNPNDVKSAISHIVKSLASLCHQLEIDFEEVITLSEKL